MQRAVAEGNAILTSLCRQLGARAALVKDTASPVVWWRSGPIQRPAVADQLTELWQKAEIELAGGLLRRGARLRVCRYREQPFGFVFSFAGIYLLLVACPSEFNRFAAEPHVRRATALLEQLVPRLPPRARDRNGPVGLARSRRRRAPR
ncbi:MAG: hypothetical protein JXR83_19185 [Deltaproteobacteria bacterium]|nr:hypothetical protein [Deltaproteobacteria bacterium]